MRKLEKPGQPEVMPLGIPRSMVTEDFTFDKSLVDIVPVYSKSVSKEAQNLIKEINEKYNLDIKYWETSAVLYLASSKMLKENKDWYGPLSIDEKGGNNFTISFENYNPSIELTKRWVTMIYPDLNLDKEIDRLVKNVNVEYAFDKGRHKIKMGQTANYKGWYIYIGE